MKAAQWSVKDASNTNRTPVHWTSFHWIRNHISWSLSRDYQIGELNNRLANVDMDESRRFSPTDRIKSQRGMKVLGGNVVRTRERMWIVFSDVHRSTGDCDISTQLHQCVHFERGLEFYPGTVDLQTSRPPGAARVLKGSCASSRRAYLYYQLLCNTPDQIFHYPILTYSVTCAIIRTTCRFLC